MGLTMAERTAVSKAIATRYKRAEKAGKTRILDELWPDSGCGADLLLGHFNKPTEARAAVSAFFVACASEDQRAAIRASQTRIYRTVLYRPPWRVPRE